MELWNMEEKTVREALSFLAGDENIGWHMDFHGENAKVVDIAPYGATCTKGRILIVIPPDKHAKLLRRRSYIRQVKEKK